MTTHEGFTTRWSPLPSRQTLWVGALMLLTALVITALLAATLQADREALVQGVERDRAEQLNHVVSMMSQDVGDVVGDLELIARIAASDVGDAVRHDAIEAMITPIPAYRAVGVWDPHGTRWLSVVDPRRSRPPSVIDEAMSGLAQTLRDADRSFEVSATIAAEGAYFRVFGHRGADRSVAVIAVETSAWLSGLRIVSSDPMLRVVVLGPSGRPSPGFDLQFAEAFERASDEPDVAGLRNTMSTGARGTLRLAPHAARSLGMADAAVVATYAPMQLREGEFWSVATLTSVASLEEQEAALVQRFALALGGMALLFVSFLVHVVATTRRTAVLRERLAHAAQLAEINAQLLHAEKLATVGGLSAGIAHEIGTPLGVIRGRAEYVIKKVGEDHPQAPSLRTIVDQIDRVAKIIRELLDYSRPRPADGRPTALDAVVAKTVALLQIEFERADVTLDLALPQRLPPLRANPDHLQQVLINLLINARDACEAGDLVRIAARTVDSGICIEVTDSGAGIPETYVSQIFDPFFTTKKRGQGTGLGLAVVSQIVRSHAGEIEVDSTEGEGTTIRIYWPTA